MANHLAAHCLIVQDIQHVLCERGRNDGPVQTFNKLGWGP